MDRILVVGCSFISFESREPMPPWDKINYKKYHFRGTPAGGNIVIAERVKHEVLNSHWDQVVVVWTGINRIDIPKTKYQYEELPKTYSFVQQIGDMYWFLSGGVCGSWQVADACPEPVYTQFMQAFVDQTQISASDITLKCIVDTQEFLKNKNIPFTMAWIYDVNKDYNSDLDVFGNRNPRKIMLDRWPHWLALEHCLGKIDKSSSWYDNVDWSFFPSESTAFEWCAERKMLEPDRFHPTKEGMIKWFRELDIYLTDS